MSFDNIAKDSTTPIVRQYIEIKKSHQDALVFFRVGDFYELFYKDAEIASKELGITLTRKAVKNVNIPMAGVPFHSYENYLVRLVKAGFKVAICEQLETPLEAKKLKKDVVDRAVVRIITPGTITEENILIDGCHNYLSSIYVVSNSVAISWVDVSTGDFFVEYASKKEIINILFRINPKEILIEEKNLSLLEDELKTLVTILPSEKFNYLTNNKILESFFKTNIYSTFKEAEIITCGVLLDYLTLTQKSGMPHLLVPKVWNQSQVMRLDFFTRRSLEIDKKLNGEYKGSLSSVIDKTSTKGGKRLLQEWLTAPLIEVDKINQRLEVVDFFYTNHELLKSITSTLKNSPDLARIFTKLVLNRGGPRDLFALKEALNSLTLIRSAVVGVELPLLIKDALINAGNFSYLQEELQKALKDFEDLPSSIKGGSFIKNNYCAELESFKAEYNNTLKKLVTLQEQYALKANIPVTALKIQNNNLMGYFIEVTSKNATTLLEDSFFIHKQTLTTCVRLTTSELINTETYLIKIKAKIEAFEERVFQDLINLTQDYKEQIFNVSRAISLIDVLSSFAYIALEYNLIKPEINNSNNIKIIEGRHIVVERGLKLYEEKQFISNDCNINTSGYIFVITGPNMAGKSTFLRQNAIIIILAQIGCYVPAKEASIGIVDAVFSRVGASDNLYKGQSTFMVEMAETATILNHATQRSFIILDEIGRGTATYDGLSIAFAVLYYLHNVIKAKTLFATHYHELTTLKNNLKFLKTFYMKVENDNNELIFMHNVVSGVANKSYGIYAAKIAGMPKDVISRAENYLFTLETQTSSSKKLPLFSYANSNEKSDAANNIVTQEDELNAIGDKIIKDVGALNIDNLTPKDALTLLYKFKEQIQEHTTSINKQNS